MGYVSLGGSETNLGLCQEDPKTLNERSTKPQVEVSIGELAQQRGKQSSLADLLRLAGEVPTSKSTVPIRSVGHTLSVAEEPSAQTGRCELAEPASDSVCIQAHRPTLKGEAQSKSTISAPHELRMFEGFSRKHEFKRGRLEHDSGGPQGVLSTCCRSDPQHSRSARRAEAWGRGVQTTYVRCGTGVRSRDSDRSKEHFFVHCALQRRTVDCRIVQGPARNGRIY